MSKDNLYHCNECGCNITEVTIFRKGARRVKGRPPEYEVRLWQEGKHFRMYTADWDRAVIVPLTLGELKRLRDALVKFIVDQP